MLFYDLSTTNNLVSYLINAVTGHTLTVPFTANQY